MWTARYECSKRRCGARVFREMKLRREYGEELATGRAGANAGERSFLFGQHGHRLHKGHW